MTFEPMRELEIFRAAIAIRDAGEREAFLQQECGGDASFRARIDALIATMSIADLEPAIRLSTAELSVLAAPTETRQYQAEQSESQTHNYTIASSSDTPVMGSRTDTLMDPVGTILGGKYRLQATIGEGGMGSVWLAQQTDPVKRAVAVKLIKAGMDSRAVLARFEQERQALAMMDHPNIARVFDAGQTEGGRPFFVMELVSGEPITRFCDQRRFSIRQRLELFIPICLAIQHAHQKGVIHRDIKPSNVLVTMYDDRPVPKVIDFGVAKATQPLLDNQSQLTNEDALIGTPEYMSPEQASQNNFDIDTRSDVYSLGVLLYELLTGTTPVDRKSLARASVFEVLQIVREVEAPRPSQRLNTTECLPDIALKRNTDPEVLVKTLRSELDWIVLKALEKERSLRYDSTHSLARDIQRFLNDEVVEARPPTRSYRLRKWMRRYRAPVIVGLSFMLLLTVATVVSVWQAIRATRAEHDARAAGVILDQKTRDAEQARKEAERTADDALAVRSLLVDILKQGSAIGRAEAGQKVAGPLTVKQAIDYTARTVGTRFKDRPRVEGEVRDSLGTMYFNLGAFKESAEQLEKAVAIRTEELGPAAEDTLKSLNNLGVVYRALKRYDEAEKVMQDVLVAKQRVLGPDHRSTLATINNLGNLYLVRKDFVRAEQYFEEALNGRMRVLGEDDPDTQNSLNNVASVRFQTNRFAEALPLYQAAADKFTKRLSRDSPLTMRVLKNLGLCHHRLGNRPEAEKLLLDVVERAMKLQPSERDVFLPEMSKEIVSMYEGWNEPEEAARWRQKLKDYLPNDSSTPPSDKR